MKFYRWLQYGGAGDPKPPLLWYLHIQLVNFNERDLMAGRYTENWDPDTIALYDDEVEYTDFPFTNNDLPVYSPRLKALVERLGVEGIQYLPLRIRHRHSDKEVQGYYLVNYLHVIDCLDRERSIYQIWTKDNLLFWEKRPQMLGTFRDVQKAVLDPTKVGNFRIFRLWGWEMMVIVRADVKQAIGKANLTGCRFDELEVR
jgi:Immunity protein family (Imm11)